MQPQVPSILMKNRMLFLRLFSLYWLNNKSNFEFISNDTQYNVNEVPMKHFLLINLLIAFPPFHHHSRHHHA